MSSLLTFFLITFAVTWCCWITVIAVPLQGVVRTAVILAGVFAPSLAAITVTALTEGRSSIRALLGRMFRWRVAPGWYLFAVSYMAGAKLLAAVVHRVVLGSWPAFGHLPVPLMLAAILVSTPVQSGEEIGWRGFALPRLAARMGYARASILLGLIWAGWHLPQFYIAGDETSGQSFPIWAIQVVAVSIAMAWVFAGSRGSLLVTMMMHSAINQTSGIVSGAVSGASDVFTLHASPMAYFTGIILWTMAVVCLWSLAKTKAPALGPWVNGIEGEESGMGLAGNLPPRTSER